ncbi:MAG: Xylose transport system permease protein XylH [bacterium ADurb.Bin243]|nr:MAG: Xylose transport system permease protein XylH [bacterium ADurb.Bin243]HOD41039.1 sugar ABC transporter permease [Candidatus Wallbacteria bacterium]
MQDNETSLYQTAVNSFKNNFRQYTMIIALAAIWIIFTFATNHIFITPRNLSNLFLQTVPVAILAAGMTLIIVTGNIDLSVGALAGFCGAVAAVLQVKYQFGTFSVILAALGVGLVIGLWHGFWIAYQKVPAFIVTLSSMLALRGAVLGVTDGMTIGPMQDSFKAIGQKYLPPYFSAGAGFNDSSLAVALICITLFLIFDWNGRRARIKFGFEVLPLNAQILRMTLIALAMAAFFSVMIFYQGIAYSVLLLIAITVVFSFVSTDTVFGRRLYAIGGNADAARLSGINIEKNILMLYLIYGVLTAVAGVVLTARLNAATTSAGTNMELDAIAAAVIGGTSLLGGEGTIVGAIIGALIMASLDNGMSLMNMNITYQYIIKGMILLFAVWLDIYNRRK